jgi:hypothetical protein
MVFAEPFPAPPSGGGSCSLLQMALMDDGGVQVSLNLSTINTEVGPGTPRGRRVPRASSAPLTPAARHTVSPAATHRSVGASSETSGKKRRKRSEQQQMNNKIAQQRCFPPFPLHAISQ